MSHAELHKKQLQTQKPFGKELCQIEFHMRILPFIILSHCAFSVQDMSANGLQFLLDGRSDFHKTQAKGNL